MANDQPEDDASLTTPEIEPTKGLTEGLWSYALVAIGLAIAGVVVAALLIWTALVRPANTEHRAQLQSQQAREYAALLNDRLTVLRHSMAAAASSPATSAAVTTYDPAALAAEGQRLTRLIGSAERVEIVPKGKAAVDLNARVPISFAALDVIKRAETTEFVGPEASSVNQRIFYAASPISDGATVTGVLFAAVSMDYLVQPLKDTPQGLGQIALEQQFEGTAPSVVLQYGDDPGATTPVRVKLNAPTWTLVFKPNASAVADVIGTTWLWTPIAAAVALILAGVYLSYSRLFRALERDGSALIDVLRGRTTSQPRYRLGMFQRIAAAANRTARKAPAAPEPSRPAPRKAMPKVSSKKPSAPAPIETPEVTADENDGDFLEVRTPEADDDNFGIAVSEDVSPIAMGLKLDPQIFRSYDIRGIVTTNFTEDVVYWIGRAFAAEAKQHNVARAVVACDGRESSPGLKKALTRGLTEGGIDVTDIGQVPTPLLYYATHALDTGTGLMITGSHNPPEYNGVKMMLAGETLAGDRIAQLRTRIERNQFSEGEGAYEEIAMIDHYVERVLSDVAVAQPLKVVVDCGNGVAGAVVPRLITEMGCEVVPLYCEVDGSFPNHHPDPADPANLQDLITVVKAEKADLGLAFDGDGDRLGVVTERGEIIWPDKLLMLFARDIVGRNPGADVIFDVKCSRHLNTLVSEYGGRPIMWKTGHSHMKAKLKETGALLAGEFSGHICFGERWYGFDDALYSAARLLEIVGSESKSVSKLFAEFPVTFTTPEIKVNTTESAKFTVMDKLARQGDFGDGTVTTIDGIRVDYSDGWGLVRPSNTSPVLTLRFEADSQAALDRIQRVFREQLKKIDPKLAF